MYKYYNDRCGIIKATKDVWLMTQGEVLFCLEEGNTKALENLTYSLISTSTLNLLLSFLTMFTNLAMIYEILKLKFTPVFKNDK